MAVQTSRQSGNGFINMARKVKYFTTGSYLTAKWTLYEALSKNKNLEDEGNIFFLNGKVITESDNIIFSF